MCTYLGEGGKDVLARTRSCSQTGPTYIADEPRSAKPGILQIIEIPGLHTRPVKPHGTPHGAVSTHTTRSTTLKIHPIATMFPPLTNEELHEITSSVRAHGLRHPIVLGPDGVLLDGRHRLAVCEVLGIEPRFTTYEGDDPDGYVLIVNLRQRDLTTGQAAMIATKAQVGTETNEHLAPAAAIRSLSEMTGISMGRLELADFVMRHEPNLVDLVITRAVSLDKAHGIALASKARAQASREHLARLRTEAPDLADRVITGEFTEIQAWNKYTERVQEDIRQRRVATYLLCDVVTALAQTRGSRTFAKYDPQYQAPGRPVTRETITHAMTALTEMDAVWRERDLP
ncbi:plasmid replication/partition related protein [Streptomyces virginiae]|uniref:plasmid replication/partition related protein n=1 Tax=Streptomyces virginiae TaxID=1961 RepID=UPI003666923B